jgi:hypothetical protein
MSDTGWKSSTAEATTAGADGVTWSNTSNIRSQDATPASTVGGAGGFDSGEESDILKAYDFNFSIPTGSEITGVQVKMVRQKRYDADGGVDRSLRTKVMKLVYGGSLVGSDNSGDTADWQAASGVSTDNYETVTLPSGDESNLWGLSGTINEAYVEHSSFGVAIQVEAFATATNTRADIDLMQMKVFYTEPVSEFRCRVIT